MPLTANFRFFSGLLTKNNFLNTFNEFKCSKHHYIPGVYDTNHPKRNSIARNMKPEHYLHNHNNSYKPALLTKDTASDYAQTNAIIFLFFDEDGYPLFKWHCTNNNYLLIYSRFIHQAVHHYYVVACTDKRNRIDMKNNELKKTWFNRTKEYRLRIIHQTHNNEPCR